MTSGRYTARQLAELYLRAHRGDRSPRPDAALGHRAQSRRARHRRRARRRAQGEGPARAAARHPRPDQGQHRHRRPDDDDRRLARARRGRSRRATPSSSSALRAAGAVILGKTNLSEWANFRSTHSTSGWSGRGGQVQEPVRARSQSLRIELGHRRRDRREPRRDRRRHRDRRLDRLSVGRERAGRHQADASAWSAGAGIIPISHSQDTAGPMARTVADAALLARRDDRRDATPRDVRTTRASNAGALEGRAHRRRAQAVLRLQRRRRPAWSNQAIADMKAHGAVIVDPADIPDGVEDGRLRDGGAALRVQGRSEHVPRARSGPRRRSTRSRTSSPSTSARRRARCRTSGRSCSLRAQKKGPLTSPAYRAAPAKCRALARAQGIDLVLRRHRLDAIVAPTGSPAWTTDLVNGDHFTGASSTPAAVAGYAEHHRAGGAGVRAAGRHLVHRRRVVGSRS